MPRLLIYGFVVLFALIVAVQASVTKLPKPLSDDDYRHYPIEQVKLGRLLFYDRLLSGTYRVSCATCHHPDRATSNGFRNDGKIINSVDEIAVDDISEYLKLKPSAQHAPTLYNLGARQFRHLFVDGRVSETQTKREFQTPAGEKLPRHLRDVLAAQALFPIVTGDEQVGTVDNELARISRQGDPAVWSELAKRVRELPEYGPYIKAAFPEIEYLSQFDIAHVANAISAFIGYEWRSDQAPFDAYLRGDRSALSAQQVRGLELFYGKFNCSSCHSGALQTDHRFHGIAMPIWGLEKDLGKVRRDDIHTGRGEVTGKKSDFYRYRTPSLRNVTKSPPYGHAGSLVTLEEAVRHHFDPEASLNKYLVERTGRSDDVARDAAGLLAANELGKVQVSDDEIADILAFLESLTDPGSVRGKLDVPKEVPSSLLVD